MVWRDGAADGSVDIVHCGGGLLSDEDCGLGGLRWCRPFGAQRMVVGWVTTGSIPVGHCTHGNMILPRLQR